MKLRRFSTWFTSAGVILGSIAILGFALDLMPSLPAPVLKLVIYKLTFIGALGLVFFGAIIGRLARTQEYDARDDVVPGAPPPELPAPMASIQDPAAQAAKVTVNSERDA